MNTPVFVYYYKDSGTAIATLNRDDFVGQLLFTCPLEWCPKDHHQFIKAALFYNVQQPHRMKFADNTDDDIPF